MNRAISIVLLIVGIMLIVWGFHSSESFNSGVSRFFTGSPTDRTIWFLVGGIAMGIVGLVGMLRGSKGN